MWGVEMDTFVTFLHVEIRFFLVGLALIIAYQILTGRISTKKMFAEKDGTGRFSIGRVQLLVLTLTGAFYYVLQVVDNPSGLPEVSQDLLLILGGSNIIYLGGKARLFRLLFRR